MSLKKLYLSRSVQVTAGFLCVEPSVFGDRINITLYMFDLRHGDVLPVIAKNKINSTWNTSIVY
jgi:hypothetical protein